MFAVGIVLFLGGEGTSLQVVVVFVVVVVVVRCSARCYFNLSENFSNTLIKVKLISSWVGTLGLIVLRWRRLASRLSLKLSS